MGTGGVGGSELAVCGYPLFAAQYGCHISLIGRIGPIRRRRTEQMLPIGVTASCQPNNC